MVGLTEPAGGRVQRSRVPLNDLARTSDAHHDDYVRVHR